jgi:hypothetical protein
LPAWKSALASFHASLPNDWRESVTFAAPPPISRWSSVMSVTVSVAIGIFWTDVSLNAEHLQARHLLAIPQNAESDDWTDAEAFRAIRPEFRSTGDKSDIRRLLIH